MPYKWTTNRRASWLRKKLDDKDKQKFQNVGLIKQDHELLRELAEGEQRSIGPPVIGIDSTKLLQKIEIKFKL